MAGFDNRSGFSFGDTVLASYALPDQDKVAHQPGVIVSSSTYNQQRAQVLIMAIAAHHRPDGGPGEMAVLSPQAAGLDRGAAFNPMLVTVEQQLVRLILGHLEDHDRERLRHLLDLILGI